MAVRHAQRKGEGNLEIGDARGSGVATAGEGQPTRERELDDVIFSDGNRIGSHTAAVAVTRYENLGRWVAVMDAEMSGIAMGWTIADRVATAAIGRIAELQFSPPRSWIEERVVRAQEGG